MLTPLTATPNWWDMPGYSRLQQVSMDTCKDVDLDVLQAAINLNHRDKFLCDRASRRVAMKRLYQRHPVTNVCQEGVSKCSDTMGAKHILLIVHRICFKRSQGQAVGIKIHNRAATIRAHKTKADYDTAKGCTVAPSHRTGHGLKVVVAATLLHYKACRSSSVMGTSNDSVPCCRETAVMIESGGMYLLAIICQHLLLSGDVELNPGPLDGEYGSCS